MGIGIIPMMAVTLMEVSLMTVSIKPSDMNLQSCNFVVTTYWVGR